MNHSQSQPTQSQPMATNEPPTDWPGIVDSLATSVWVLGVNGVVRFANTHAGGSLGFAPDQMIGRFVWDFDPLIQPDRWDEILVQIRRDGTLTFDSIHRRHDGHEFPVVIHATLNQPPASEPFLVVHVRDNTDVRRDRERLQLAIEAAWLGFWDLKLDTGDVYVSPELRQQIGQSPDVPWTIQTWRDLLHEDDRPAAVALLAAYLAGEKPAYRIVFRLRHADGSYRWIESRGRSVRDPDGKVVRMIGTHTDITALKFIEEELRRTLDKSERMSQSLQRSNTDLQQFASVASHDLRAPLRGVRSLVSFIRDDLAAAQVDLPVGVIGHLDDLHEQVRRMDGLLCGLLEYSRVGHEHGRVDDVTLATLLDNAIGMAGVPDSFRIERPAENPTWPTDGDALQRVFQNLIDNAVKHHDQTTGVIRILCRDGGDHFWFRIIDDGPGIAERHRERAFAIFQSLGDPDQTGASGSGNGSGSGLGLTIVKKLVVNHGGQISLHAASPRGTAVHVRWPKTMLTGE